MDPFPHNRRTGAFERRIARALDRLIPPDAAVVVACSGGADSTATLVAIARSGRRVTIAHFDHHIRSRADADADRAAVAALARTLDVPLHCGEGRGGSTAEDAAREERYRWLATAAGEAGTAYVVTGHTLDDQAETVLFRLTRGAGLTGAAGMAELAPWPVAVEVPLQLVRPLLGIERREVEAYLAALGIEPRHDVTNDDVTYGRNRLRHRVLPELRAINAHAARALAAFAARAGADDAALDIWAEKSFAAITNIEERRVVIDRIGLRALPIAVRARVLRRAAAQLRIHLQAVHLDAADLAIGHTGAQIVLAGGRLCTTRAEVIVEADHPPVDASATGG